MYLDLLCTQYYMTDTPIKKEMLAGAGMLVSSGWVS